MASFNVAEITVFEMIDNDNGLSGVRDVTYIF